ncbi:hypothetical protein AGLY_006080, partial [Aphis glycines]
MADDKGDAATVGGVGKVELDPSSGLEDELAPSRLAFCITTYRISAILLPLLPMTHPIKSLAGLMPPVDAVPNPRAARLAKGLQILKFYYEDHKGLLHYVAVTENYIAHLINTLRYCACSTILTSSTLSPISSVALQIAFVVPVMVTIRSGFHLLYQSHFQLPKNPYSQIDVVIIIERSIGTLLHVFHFYLNIHGQNMRIEHTELDVITIDANLLAIYLSSNILIDAMNNAVLPFLNKRIN